MSLDPWCYERIPPIFGLYLRKRSSNTDASATIGNVHVLIKISNGASGHERGNRGFTVVASLLVHCEDAIPSCNIMAVTKNMTSIVWVVERAGVLMLGATISESLVP